MSNFFQQQDPLATPGTYTVKYPQGNIDEVVKDLSPNEIKERLAEVYSELSQATINLVGSIITFSLKQGSKN